MFSFSDSQSPRAFCILISLFGVMIKASAYDMKNSIVMQKTRRSFELLSWTHGVVMNAGLGLYDYEVIKTTKVFSN